MKHSANPILLRDNVTVSHLYSTYTHNFPRNYRFDGEKHDFWELGYIVRGNVGITSDDKIYKCKEGDLVIHPPNFFHTCWGINKAEFTIFTISFSCENPNSVIPPCKIALSEREKLIINLLMEAANVCFMHSNGEFYYNEDAENIPQYGSIYYQTVKNYLEILLLQIIEDGPADSEQPISDDAAKYNNIVNFLKQNVCLNLSVEEIAKEMFESVGNIKRIFHKFTNMGIIKYYNNLRVDYAINLISKGYSIHRVAELMNFSSQNYFSYFFKKATGQSPSVYRHELSDGKNSDKQNGLNSYPPPKTIE